MNTKFIPSFLTLMLMISFGSVNAVLFTPALPNISHFFHINTAMAQQTITWFLVGYALGQLIYGPLVNRFGRIKTLYAGTVIQIISSLICVLAGFFHFYTLLIIGRFFLAIGSASGLKIAYTLVNEYYQPEDAQRKTSYLMMSFAMAPGLGIAIGGVLNAYFGWMSCFYAGAAYGLFLLFLFMKLQETKLILDKNALKIKNIAYEYILEFKNFKLFIGGFLIGLCTCFIYIFSAICPFIAMNILGMNSSEYGLANILPPIGLISGSLLSAMLTKFYTPLVIIKNGFFIAVAGILLMIIMAALKLDALLSLFFPMTIIYAGLALVLGNTAGIVMTASHDKAHGSAVMNFINLAFATAVVLFVGLFQIDRTLLPIVFAILALAMFVVYRGLNKIFSLPASRG